MGNPARYAAPLLLLALAGCGSAAASEPKKPATFDVAGTMQLLDVGGIDYYASDEGEFCTGEGGYTDMQAGAQVLIRNADGRTVGVGHLGVGGLTGDPEVDGVCEFPLTVEKVKAKGDIFSVEVASRGEVVFKRADAGSLALTLGP